MELVDPTVGFTGRKQIDYVPRPAKLHGLRIGLVENTKNNSERFLRVLAEKLQLDHGMTLATLIHKPQRGPLKGDQVSQLRGAVDFAIIGVGA